MSPLKRPKTGGMKKGWKAPQTLDKIMARERLRSRVIAALDPLLDAQIANAQGLKYLVTRDKKTGKFLKLTREMAETLTEQLGEEATEIIEVWDKDPSVQAFTDLLNRALDKPTEYVDMEVSGSLGIEERIKAGRARLGKR